ncbi:unnamed protein product [Victoria cruziana]
MVARRTCSVLLAREHVADTADREDAFGGLRVGFDGRTDATHVHVDGAVKGLEFAAAHGFHDLVAREHTAGAFGQRDQQVELVGGQLAELVVDADVARIAVDGQRTKAHLAAGRRPVATLAAQHGADARQQLTRLEGLGQVIVGAKLQADHAVHGVTLGREHQDGGLGQRRRQGADAPAHLEAVHVGQHQIQDQQLGQGIGTFESCQSLFGGACHLHTEARLPEVFADHGGQTGVVFDHQQGLAHVGKSIAHATMMGGGRQPALSRP